MEDAVTNWPSVSRTGQDDRRRKRPTG